MMPKEFRMITRIWHGATPATKSDEYLTKPDANHRHTRLPLDLRQQGRLRATSYGNTAHFLMITFWESEEAIRTFAGDDISVAKYYDFDKDFLIELEPCSTHYEMYDK
jgi:hypothetical protein